MALTRSELRVLAILGLVILILWSFFGLFWSLLLVFSFLIYAYNFGRHGNGKIQQSHEEVDSEPDLKFHEKSRNDYPALQDLEFTGLPTKRYSLRSPAPLMSVTKRLSFNMSSTTPFQTRKAWNSREMNGTQYPARGSAFAYHRKPHNFSLLNPALQRPSTVKIASPDVTVNRTFTLTNSPLKRAGVDVNPCSRVTVLSALRESRKRSLAVFDEEEEEVSRPSKRRDTKPVESYPFSSPLLRGRKRVAILERTVKAADGGSKKKSKVVEDSACDSSDNEQNESHTETVTQKRKNMETETEPPVSEDIAESAENTGEEEVGSNKEMNKGLDYGDKSMETEHNQTQNDSASRKRKEAAAERDATKTSDDKSESTSKKTKESEPLTDNEEDKRRKTEYLKKDVSPLLKPPAKKVQKRFTVPRFASKDDSRRRAVPVYCASDEESEMPQRRTVSRKINQEQIKIDRKLAWERVNELLGGNDDDDEDEVKEKEKSDTTTVSSAATTSTSTSLFKVPTAGVVTSRGTITTTTAQSLITPAPSLGDPRRTTGNQGVPSSSVSSSNPIVHGNATVTQSQSSTLPALPSSQQRPGVDLFSKSSKIVGPSTALTGQGLNNPSTLQGKTGTTSSSIAAAQSQANPAQTSTVTTGQVSSGFQLSSSSSFGASSFAKPASTNPPTLDTNIISSQKAGFSFSTVPSSSVSGMPLSTATTNSNVQAGFNFSAYNSTQTVSTQKSTQNTQVTTSVNSSTSFFLGKNTSKTHEALANGNITAASQSPFQTLPKTTQNSSVLTAIPSTNVFGQSAAAPQNSLASTTKNRGTFGVSNMQSVTGQQGQTSFGSSFSGSSFGAKPSQKTPQASNSTNSTQSPLTQNTFGAPSNQNASQSAFRANPAHSAFGAPQQNLHVTPSAFGAQNTNSSLNAGQKTSQSGFGTQPLQNAFGSQQKTTQNLFGNQANQNVFGPKLNQSGTQSAFGTQSTQFSFGAQPNQKTTQSAFGATSNQKSSPFTFAANTSQNPSNSPFGGFGNKAGTQNTFGTAPSQNAAASSGGFSFNTNATANNPTSGGFNFSGAANKTGGFQFGSSVSSNSFGQFGQATAPSAVPATPAPSGGFNFAPGGTSGSPFAAPKPAPAFGASSTPQGGGSNLTARSRVRLAARRRGKK